MQWHNSSLCVWPVWLKGLMTEDQMSWEWKLKRKKLIHSFSHRNKAAAIFISNIHFILQFFLNWRNPYEKVTAFTCLFFVFFLSPPRSNWPHDDVPPYIPEFYDGWQPPPPSHMRAPLLNQNGPMSRSNSQRFQRDRPDGQRNEGQSFSPRASQRQLERVPYSSSGTFTSRFVKLMEVMGVTHFEVEQQGRHRPSSVSAVSLVLYLS